MKPFSGKRILKFQFLHFILNSRSPESKIKNWLGKKFLILDVTLTEPKLT